MCVKALVCEDIVKEDFLKLHKEMSKQSEKSIIINLLSEYN